jgi:hypothetical protein
MRLTEIASVADLLAFAPRPSQARAGKMPSEG